MYFTRAFERTVPSGDGQVLTGDGQTVTGFTKKKPLIPNATLPSKKNNYFNLF